MNSAQGPRTLPDTQAFLSVSFSSYCLEEFVSRLKNKKIHMFWEKKLLDKNFEILRECFLANYVG